MTIRVMNFKHESTNLEKLAEDMGVTSMELEVPEVEEAV
jgi:hypothetical protein